MKKKFIEEDATPYVLAYPVREGEYALSTAELLYEIDILKAIRAFKRAGCLKMAFKFKRAIEYTHKHLSLPKANPKRKIPKFREFTPDVVKNGISLKT